MPRMPQSAPTGLVRPGDAIAEELGVDTDLGAPVTAVVRAEEAFAFATGDGRVVFASRDFSKAVAVSAHSGAVLSTACSGGAVLSGGDDGRVVQTVPDGTTRELWKSDGKWIDCVASSAAGALAWASGKAAYWLASGEAEPLPLRQRSSVGGLGFAPKSERLAVAHYGGVTIWNLAAQSGTMQMLPWMGSHLDLSWSPDERFILTAMQEGALHGWRLSDGADFAMNGYQTKPRSLSWSRKGQWLVTSGAPDVMLWPFTGKGPMGKSPLARGRRPCPVSCVACHPINAYASAGYQDGVIQLTRQEDEGVLLVRRAGRSPITGLAWSKDGRRLAWGAENGQAGIVDFARLDALKGAKR